MFIYILVYLLNHNCSWGLAVEITNEDRLKWQLICQQTPPRLLVLHQISDTVVADPGQSCALLGVLFFLSPAGARRVKAI